MSRGFFDIQINGYMGVDFNSDGVTPQRMRKACDHLRDDGVDMILATITTERIDKMAARLAAIVAAREADPIVRKMVVGFHIEGPFLSPEAGYRGAHPQDAIHPADADEMKQLLDAAGGLTRLVTLAPEHDKRLKVTKMLAKKGIRVSAGHCNPSLDELDRAIDAGLTHYTHLGNGCPMQMHRHENIVQRALSLHDRLWLCFIADGAHVYFPALGNYLRACDLDRVVAVTDAISAAGMGPGLYKLGRWEVKVGKDLVARAPDGSHLVGAAVTMPQTFKNLVEKVGLTTAQARKLTVTNPRKSLGL